MEDVLDVYSQPAEAGVVRLCFDERPCQLLDHVLTPIPPKPGATQKEHQEYVRKGVCNVLLAYNLDTGQRHLQVTTTKKKGDYAHFMDWLVQTHYPDTQKIKLVQDNYSTHCYGAFYENLPVETARHLRHTLEFHYTPKHGSWLNIAEIELSCLTKQCLGRRIATLDALNLELTAWTNAINADERQVDWRFTTKDARIKLRHLYPVL